MLQVSPSSPTDLNRDLVTIWLARYLPDLGLIPQATRRFFEERLSVVVSLQARQATQKKLIDRLDIDCNFAAMRAQRLVAESGQTLQLLEAKALSKQIYQVYETLLELYVQEFVFSPVLESLYSIDSRAGKLEASSRILLGFDRLMLALEPLLVELQTLYSTSKNPRAIGFLTTQLHLTRGRLVDRLDAYERIWLAPYFRLIEDFVCIPWQRVCRATQRATAERASMAQQLLLESDAIAAQVYQRAIRTFPNHISRQGQIQTMAVQQSSLRDLVMFQAYIWLCVLEESLDAIQSELLPLCLLVFPCVNVRWNFVVQGVQWVGEEINQRLEPHQRVLMSQYTTQIEHLFKRENPENADFDKITTNLKQRFGLSIEPQQSGRF